MKTTDLMDLLDRGGIAWRSYSGRGMYGAKCVALDSDDNFGAIADMIDACATLEQAQDLATVIREAQTDAMGTGMVLYFPTCEIGG